MNDTLFLSRARYGVLMALAAYIQEKGYCPSIRELAGELDVRSHSSVHFHLDCLNNEGFLTRRPRKSRCWELTLKARGILPTSVLPSAEDKVLARAG